MSLKGNDDEILSVFDQDGALADLNILGRWEIGNGRELIAIGVLVIGILRGAECPDVMGDRLHGDLWNDGRILKSILEPEIGGLNALFVRFHDGGISTFVGEKRIAEILADIENGSRNGLGIQILKGGMRDGAGLGIGATRYLYGVPVHVPAVDNGVPRDRIELESELIKKIIVGVFEHLTLLRKILTDRGGHGVNNFLMDEFRLEQVVKLVFGRLLELLDA